MIRRLRCLYYSNRPIHKTTHFNRLKSALSFFPAALDSSSRLGIRDHNVCPNYPLCNSSYERRGREGEGKCHSRKKRKRTPNGALEYGSNGEARESPVARLQLFHQLFRWIKINFNIDYAALYWKYEKLMGNAIHQRQFTTLFVA